MTIEITNDEYYLLQTILDHIGYDWEEYCSNNGVPQQHLMDEDEFDEDEYVVKEKDLSDKFNNLCNKIQKQKGEQNDS